ncbi:MAG: 4-vinyl reductase [Gemmatimonadetes bacterium]|nr:4-vinyl reductase [Gemmatimonadota bacterium]
MTSPSASSPHALDLPASGMVALTRDALTSLRASLFREAGPGAAAWLQEAGYAGGGALFDAFARWCAVHGLGSPEQIPQSQFALRASEFFADSGWGTVTLGALHSGILLLDSSDWAEADPQSAMEFPGCHLTTGMLADFLGRMAGSQVAVMEVECRSMGAERCRFLAGSGETLQRLYDEMGSGRTYDEAAAAMA